MLFRFQWHIDKLALGPGFFLTSLLREFSTRENFLAKHPLEKETRQKIS